MRVLLAHHLPFRYGSIGHATWELARQLRAAGHEVRCLAIDGERQATDDPHVRLIVCRANDPEADLDLDVPDFSADDHAPLAFRSLSDRQLNGYRDVLRRHLDLELGDFDPHIVHAQHLWVFSHLALEAGVPYVVSAHSAEIDGYSADPRFRRLMQEAAENAGRVLADDDRLLAALMATFGDLEGRARLVPASVPELASLYAAIHLERFGP